jgi:hypothetical protein
MASLQDLYGKTTTFKSTNIITADQMVLRLGGNEAGEEYLVQNVSVQYNQPISRVFEIGTSNVYFAPGRSLGNFQIGRIIGTKAITSFLGDAGTGVWTADTGTAGDLNSRTMVFIRKSRVSELNPNSKSINALGLKYTLSGVVIESYGFATDANGLLIQENVSGQFASLEIKTQR